MRGCVRERGSGTVVQRACSFFSIAQGVRGQESSRNREKQRERRELEVTEWKLKGELHDFFSLMSLLIISVDQYFDIRFIFGGLMEA